MEPHQNPDGFSKCQCGAMISSDDVEKHMATCDIFMLTFIDVYQTINDTA